MHNSVKIARNMVPLSSLQQQFHSKLTEQRMNTGRIAWKLNIRIVRTDMDSFLQADTRRCSKNFCSTFAHCSVQIAL